MDEIEENIAYAVSCRECSALGPIVENVKDAKKAAMVLAINYWNRRSKNGESDDFERTS